MENQRLFLMLALLLVSFGLWNAWQKDYPSTPPATVAQPANTLPKLPAPSGAAATTAPGAATTAPTPTTNAINQSQDSSAQLITVKTDVFQVGINPKGGNIVRLSLPKYPETMSKDSNPFTLLNNTPSDFYIAESALVGPQGPDSPTNRGMFTSSQPSYELKPGQDTLQVQLNWKNNQGLQVSKIFTFHRDNYVIDVTYNIDNKTTTAWTGNLYTQLTRNEPASKSGWMLQAKPYIGAAVSSPDERYKEISFKKMTNENLNETITNGWAAMVQHYFLSAWIPDAKQPYQYYTRAIPLSAGNFYTVGMISPTITVNPGQQSAVTTRLYSGPEIAERLKAIAPGLDLTVSYGWLWPIAVAIFWLMKHIYDFVGNWGWAIVIVTIFIKILFYQLSAKSYRSMANMRKIQPKMEAIKERYGNDKQKLSQAMMELYKTEKINPLGGCLPILVQIPVFFALYTVLIESVELRHAPWIGWIKDLSAPDPFYILPIIMGVTMLIQQKLNPPPADPTQAKVMMFLPIVFTIFFINFPAGLVLYWVVNNVLSIAQQWYVMRTVEQTPSVSGKKKKSKWVTS